MARVVKEISDMEIDEISLVDRPANQHAKVVITKNFSEEEAMPNIYDEDGDILDFDEVTEGDVVFDETGEAFVVVDEEYADEYEEIGKAKFGVLEGLSTGAAQIVGRGAQKAQGVKARALDSKGGLFPNASAKYKRAKDDVALRGMYAKEHVGRHKVAYGAGAGGTALAGAGGGAAYHEKDRFKKSFADELREELSKSLTTIERDEVIAKALSQVDEMSQSLVEAEEIAKSERDLRLLREYTEVAKSYNVPVDADELAPVLMAIAEYLPYEYGEVIHKALGSAGDMIFAEIGYQGQADNNDVLSQVDAYIEQNVSKSDISKAEAVEAVFADNPDAYDEYLSTRSFR